MPPKRKAANMPAVKNNASKKKYGMAAILPTGERMQDINKKVWILGKSFASGGFGRIYLARKEGEGSKEENYALKMEPAENGPLFQEIHMYGRIGKQADISAFQTAQKLKFLGIPTFFGSGLHNNGGLSYRFLVLPKFGPDIEKIRCQQPHGRFENLTDICRLSITCLDALHYLHSRNIVHGDLKGENLLLDAHCDSKSANLHKTYLVDYGLAKKVSETVVYKVDLKKAHEGTLIFTSLDAHKGCGFMYRGDVEILGYNILLWTSGTLPWISDPQEKVMKQKSDLANQPERYLMENLAGNLPNKSLIKDLLYQFMNICYSTDFQKRPDYVKLNRILMETIQKASKVAAIDKKLTSSPANSKATTSRSEKRTSAQTTQKQLGGKTNEQNGHLENVPPKQTKVFPEARKPMSKEPVKKEAKPKVRQTRPKIRQDSPEPQASLSFSEDATSDDDIFAPKPRFRRPAATERKNLAVAVVLPQPSKIRHRRPNTLVTEDETTATATETSCDENEEKELEDRFSDSSDAMFKKPLPVRPSRVPGVANLESLKSDKTRIPAAAFRRRQSIEASLLTKYRKLLAPPEEKVQKNKIPGTKNGPGKFFDETSDASSSAEPEKDGKKAKKKLVHSKLKSVETQTSPGVYTRWKTDQIRRHAL